MNQSPDKPVTVISPEKNFPVKLPDEEDDFRYSIDEAKQVRELSRSERKKFLTGDTVIEAKKRMSAVLEKSGYFRMSHEEYQSYFETQDFRIAGNLKQGNFGDCYLVAALYALSRSSFFEVMVRGGMKKEEDGSWNVRWPLLHQEFKPVIVTSEDMSVQDNPKFLHRHGEGRIFPDFRRELRPLKGGEGFLALEAVFIKNKFKKIDRLAAEGGNPGRALQWTGGDFVNVVDFFPDRPDKSVKGYWPTLADLSEEDREELDFALENFDKDMHVATTSTRPLKSLPFFRRNIGRLVGGAPFKGKDVLKYFFTNHAYAVSEVNNKDKIITIVNPWNTRKPINLTFDQYKATFSDLQIAQFDANKLIEATDEARKSYRI